jgi:hypothetical protein
MINDDDEMHSNICQVVKVEIQYIWRAEDSNWLPAYIKAALLEWKLTLGGKHALNVHCVIFKIRPRCPILWDPVAVYIACLVTVYYSEGMSNTCSDWTLVQLSAHGNMFGMWTVNLHFLIFGQLLLVCIFYLMISCVSCPISSQLKVQQWKGVVKSCSTSTLCSINTAFCYSSWMHEKPYLCCVSSF